MSSIHGFHGPRQTCREEAGPRGKFAADYVPMSHLAVWAMLGSLLILAGCRTNTQQPLGQTVSVEIDGHAFGLEPAVTSKARYQGLSDRSSIDAHGGMIFVFPDSHRRTFVMRRCLVPIDIIFLDANGRVVCMYQMQVEPYDRPESRLKRYSSRYPAQFAVELKGGTLDSLSVRRGQKIALPLERLKQAMH